MSILDLSIHHSIQIVFLHQAERGNHVFLHTFKLFVFNTLNEGALEKICAARY